MTSRTFNLGDGTESNSGYWAKIFIALCCFLVVVVVIIVSVYAYKNNIIGGYNSCEIPLLDEHGLSNWTTGASTIAFACFPNYFLEGHGEILVSTCRNKSWTPQPPACNYLPLRLDCKVNFHGVVGNISMWQESVSTPAYIYGLVDYEKVDRSGRHLMDIVHISKSNCMISDDITNVTNLYPEPEPSDQVLKIEFNSTELKAYNKAEIHLHFTFVGHNTTASLVFVHQGDNTFMLPTSNPFTGLRLPRDFLVKYGFDENEN